jgi:hypothetical protein
MVTNVSVKVMPTTNSLEVAMKYKYLTCGSEDAEVDLIMPKKYVACNAYGWLEPLEI